MSATSPFVIAHRGAWKGGSWRFDASPLANTNPPANAASSENAASPTATHVTHPTLIENTPDAMQRAVTLACHGIEFDVRADAGDQPVVCHDPDLARVFARPEIVRDHGARALYRFSNGNIITLDDALDIVAPLDIIDIEIKAEHGIGNEPLVRRVIRSLARNALRSRVIITSFNPVVLALVRHLYPPVKTGFLVSPGSPAWLRFGIWKSLLRANAIAPFHGFYTGPDQRRYIAPSSEAWVWTVNDPATARAVLSARAEAPTAIITDEPVALRAWLAAQ